MVSEEEKVRSKDNRLCKKNKFGQVWASLGKLGQVKLSFGATFVMHE